MVRFESGCMLHRSWLAARSMLRGARGGAVRALEDSLLAALLLGLQRVPPLRGSAGGNAARAARATLRGSLTQAR